MLNFKSVAKTVLLFDVTKLPVLGIDNSMDAGSKTSHFISVVVPVYNSELILPALIKRLEPALASLACRNSAQARAGFALSVDAPDAPAELST